MKSIYQSMVMEPQSKLKATTHIMKILDPKYEKANLRAFVNNDCNKHVNVPEHAKLMALLKEFEELFDGTLGDWDCELVSFQLEKGVNPYHGWPFTIPKKHLETTKNKIQRLCKLGVMKWQADSEWALRQCSSYQKDNIICAVSNFREVHKWIARKLFPSPKIITVLQELDGFSYATALDLNMGYYTIKLDPDASKICTIILPWGKYSYLWLPMGFVCYPNIFQA